MAGENHAKLKRMQLLKEEDFTCRIDGRQVQLFTLQNKKGAIVQFTSYGARWVSAWMPDAQGRMDDLILGFETIDQYLGAAERYHGAVIGRVAGRISGARFSIDGKEYRLAGNDQFGIKSGDHLNGRPMGQNENEPGANGNHLHGGPGGLSSRVWDAELQQNASGEPCLFLRYISPMLEEGYPGNLAVELLYTLRDDNSVVLDYRATTDQASVVNLTNHAYFNLSGNPLANILDHQLEIAADYSVESTERLIPTGNLIPLGGTPLDFSQPQFIGARLDQSFPGQLFPHRGYALTYVLRDPNRGLRYAARVKHPSSGRVLEVFTDQPCLQFYNAWLFDGSDIGKGGRPYKSSCGFALEAQAYPDAPNQPAFPSILLRPGEVYTQRTEYRFLVME